MADYFVVIRHEFVFDCIYEITATETVIGRDQDCGLRLPCPFVSKRHALLVRTGDEIKISDLKSRNGTRINGRLVSKGEVLTAKSEVQIGPHSLTICVGLADAIQESVKIDGSTMADRRWTQVIGRGRADRPSLSPAQERVFNLFAQGLTEKEIAAQLRLTVNTVHDHAKAIYKALSVSSRGELLAYWANHPEQRTYPG
ncbi:MAG: Fis family transcriptional regulator [Planctomycetota bacterium]|nr:MAG: Fis family transcriptional regulator [Planctomycetota bacterium]